MAKTRKELDGDERDGKEVAGTQDVPASKPKYKVMYSVWTVGQYPKNLGVAFGYDNGNIDVVAPAWPNDDRMRLVIKKENDGK